MTDWRDDLLPEREIVDELRNSLSIREEGELSLLIMTCMGVKAWAFDPRFMRPSSALFVYSTFGVEEYAPHNFYKYYLDEIRLNVFSIIEHTGIDPKIDKSATYSDVRNTIRVIFPEIPDVSVISDGMIRATIQQLMRFLHDDPIVYNEKRASEIYKGIAYSKEARTGACVRMPKATAVEYEYFDDVYVEPVYRFECQYCGELVSCVQSTSNATCENCLAKRDHDEKNKSCDHVECGNYGCVHYRGNEEFQDDYCAER